MSKIFIVISLLLLALGAGGYFYISKNQATSATKDLANTTNSSKEIENTDLKTYSDESGLSFKIPSPAKVKDSTSLYSSDYYTSLDISLPNMSDVVRVSVKDTKFAKIQDWLAKDPEAPTSAQLVGASSLGGIVSANQYSFTIGTKKYLTTIAIEKQILYRVTGPADKESEDLQNIIVSSLNIAKSTASTPPNSTTTSDSNPSDTTTEAEEVIE